MPARFILSLRRDEAGGPTTAPLLYSVHNDANLPTDGSRNNNFDRQLRSATLRREDFVRDNPLLRFGRICFIIHGFNTSRSRGTWSGEELGRQGLNYDCVVAVLWPGDSWVPIIGGAVYPSVLKDAREAGSFLADFIGRLDARAEIDFVTHSFGVRVALHAIMGVVASTRRRLGQAVFLASAADETVLEWPEYRAGLQALDRMLVISSYEDETLEDLYPKGDWVEDIFFQSERGKHRALGRYGPVRREGSPLNAKLEHVEIDRRYEQDHNDYFPWPWADVTGGWQMKRRRIRDALIERSKNMRLSSPAMLRPAERFGEIPE